ncbi:cysteine hydrolase family protein [Oceanirhabdus sp. W0125-5]|uniref:cysteine hydrolase family protein n=1 Tax=Oceanirhabdus sp. W0125-5 TaxID=2999116 RepID=UPI0022F3322A|nr:cysteine hydrolase family protein [Oceanirhabdus sp. W0125-5]WBW95707.1 cysteine hydrolase family protein [Oceanirhabdus sp. W0125-5]
MGKKAILIIDVQKEMFMFEGYEPYNGIEMLKNIKSILEKGREMDIPIFFIQHTMTEGKLFREGTVGWEIHEDIAPLTNEKCLKKYNCDSFQDTGLHEILESIGVKELIIAGMQTEYCIDTAFRRSFSLGYDSILVSDGHSTFDNEVLDGETTVKHHNSILQGFGRVLSTEEVLEKVLYLYYPIQRL